MRSSLSRRNFGRAGWPCRLAVPVGRAGWPCRLAVPVGWAVGLAGVPA
ncbi:hypothetical protein ACW675_03205 [Corynebacterium aurimucosum]